MNRFQSIGQLNDICPQYLFRYKGACRSASLTTYVRKMVLCQRFRIRMVVCDKDKRRIAEFSRRETSVNMYDVAIVNALPISDWVYHALV